MQKSKNLKVIVTCWKREEVYSTNWATLYIVSAYSIHWVANKYIYI